jgi:guanine deaminase
MNYLQRAIELAQASFEAGEFPAGALLVSKSGRVYESKPSVPHNHGETMVIDMAIEAEGAPLTGAVIYTSMQPCLMCSAKMYWAGVDTVHYIIAKVSVRADYAYESPVNSETIISNFFKPINMIHHPELEQKALSVYNSWVTNING